MELADLVASGDRARLAKGEQAKNLMVYVYVIKSLSAKYRYIGITNNIQRRFEEHNLGYNKSTKTYAPFRIIVQESFEDYKEARKREIFLKSGVGRKFLNSIE